MDGASVTLVLALGNTSSWGNGRTAQRAARCGSECPGVGSTTLCLSGTTPYASYVFMRAYVCVPRGACRGLIVERLWELAG